MSDLDTLIRGYARRIDDAAPDLEELAGRADRVCPAETGNPAPTRWRRWPALAVGAVLTVAVIGVPTLLWWSSSGGKSAAGPVPAAWTAYTDVGLDNACSFDVQVAADGAVWTIGPCGLARFDGISWQRVETPDPFYAGLGDPLYTSSAAGPEGSMWFVGDTGSLYRWSAGTWTRWDPVHEEMFTSVAVGPDGTAWGVSQDQVWRLEDGEWAVIPGTFGVSGIATAPDGSLWTGLGRLDGEGITEPFPETNRLGLTLLAVGSDGSAWFNAPFEVTEHLLYRYGTEGWIGYPVFFAADVAFDAEGSAWVAVSETLAYCPPDCTWLWGATAGIEPGLYRFDGQEWTRFTTDHGLVSNDATSVAVGFDGSIWVGSRNGVTRYQPNDLPTAGDPAPQVVGVSLHEAAPVATTVPDDGF